MKRFDCIIVDDEMERLVVLSYAKIFSVLNIFGIFYSAEKVLNFLSTNTVDVAFLDIEMGEANGLELRRKSLEISICIFISSHSENAAETFELQTLDFIAKPFKFPRFEQMMQRLYEFMEVRTKANLFEARLGGDLWLAADKNSVYKFLPILVKYFR